MMFNFLIPDPRDIGIEMPSEMQDFIENSSDVYAELETYENQTVEPQPV